MTSQFMDPLSRIGSGAQVQRAGSIEFPTAESKSTSTGREITLDQKLIECRVPLPRGGQMQWLAGTTAAPAPPGECKIQMLTV